MTEDKAETIALQALAWLAADDELLPVFLGSTGASLQELGGCASDPAFLASVLEFLTMDDRWVVAFCEASGIGCEEPMQARQVLPGGGLPNWT